ncbi:MAG: fibronectin type III domain-containing protein, partial [Chloroflexota bacterium]
GAVYVDLLIDNTDFIANTGSFGFGASALAFRDSNVVVTNSRFLDNVSSEASALASAFDVQDSTGRFNNNCVVGNTDTAVTVALDNPIPAFDARFNWWGEPAGASNAGTGVWADSVAGDINVSSPLTSAPLGCPSATVPTDNYLTGIITNESGTPLSSMLVTAVDYNGGGYFAETCTNQSGRYVIEDLPANTDIVVHAGGALVNQACGGSDAYMLEYYADDTIPDESVYTPFNATILQSQGNVFSDVDIELGIAGIITVTVEDEDDSQPIQYINVRSEWGSPSYSSVSYCTDFRGEVEIRVPLGVASTVDASARIGACGEIPDPYVWEFYADVNNPRGAETITLTEATPTEAITMQLALGGIITGTVADTNSQGLANVSVSVSSFDNTFPEIPIESTYGGGLTDPTGAYTAYGVPFDTPIILHTQSAEYGITFWQDSVMSIDATPVTLTSGTPQQTIDFVLEGSSGTILGTVYDADGVTPLAGVPVRIAGASWYSGQTYCTDNNGSYGLFNVNVGSEYIIAAGGLYDGSCANESEPLIYYNQQFDFATATRLTLSQANTTGIDFVLTAESFGTTVDNANISTDEGSEATNSGTYNDVLPSELAISASVGTAVNNNDGTWSWSYTPDDGPAETQTVTLTFDETTSSRQATAEFDLVVNNVAPTGSLTFAQGLQPNTPIDIFFESVADVSSADAGQLSNFTYDVDCDTDGNYEATNVSLANPAVTCTYVSVGSYTVTGILRDKDGGELIDTLAITIAEISPPTLLSATVGATNTDVTLLLEGAPNEVYDVNFYSVASCDGITPTSTPSLLTSISVVTDGNGVFDNTVTLSSITLAPSERILLEADRVVSSDVSVLSDCGLATPTNLSGTSTQISFDLTWQNSDSDQTSTELEVSTNGGSTWSLLQTLGNVTSATVDNLQCGTALSFRVRGVNEVQNRVSAYSNVFTGSTVACPPNDAVASATVFTSLPFTDSQSTLGAISEIGDPQPTCGTNVGNSIWYSFTPATSGTYQFNTIGSDYDAVLAMYTGNIGSLSEIGCDKDSAPGTQAVLNLSLTSGITYRILMGANEGQGGNAVFTARNLLVPTATPVPTNTPLPTLAPDPVLTTVGLYDAELGLWQFRDSNASGYADVVFNWGMDGDGWVGVIGDWDGDGVDGIGMYRDGLWLLRNSATLGNANIEVRFGEAGWQPIVGDWNGDGIDNVGVYRDGQFMLNMNGTVQMFTFDPLGQGGTPIAGDWDGINGDTVGLYNAGVWALADSNMANASANVFSYGEPTWLPVVGDWNENGIDTIGGYRNGRWYLRNHNNAGASDVAFAFAGVGVPLTSYRGGAPALTMLSENMIIQPTTQPATSTDSPIVLPSSSSMPSLTPTSMPAATSTATPENSPEATEEIP